MLPESKRRQNHEIRLLLFTQIHFEMIESCYAAGDCGQAGSAWRRGIPHRVCMGIPAERRNAVKLATAWRRGAGEQAVPLQSERVGTSCWITNSIPSIALLKIF